MILCYSIYRSVIVLVVRAFAVTQPQRITYNTKRFHCNQHC